MISAMWAGSALCHPRVSASRFLTLLAPLLLLWPARSLAEPILDQMWIVDRRSYTHGNGNHSGGMLVWGDNYSLELCDDFYTTATGYIITEVEVGNLTFGLERPASAWVSIYEVARGSGSGAIPKETALYDARHEVTTSTPFEDPYFGLSGLKTTISGLSISLSPSTQYFISVQTESGDWAYTARSYGSSDGADSYMRDNGRNGYHGGYGWTTWRRNHGSFEYADSAYRIEAIPEPGSSGLLLMLVGAARTVRRRRAG